jgi:hypothetical protein
MEINLNLIPPYREEEIQKSKRFRLIVKLEMFIVAFVLVFFIFLFSLGYILDLNLKTVSNEIESSREKKQLDNIKKYDEEFSQANAEFLKIEKINNDQLYWSTLYLKLSQSIIPGISMQSLATKDYAVFLVGKADSRENLVTFKDNLGKESCFSEINLPLSDLVSKGNIDFQMDLKIKDECVHSVK